MKEADYTVEYSKVMISLSGLLLGLSVTFLSEVAISINYALWFALAAWVSWVVSIYFGGMLIRNIAVIAGDAEEAASDAPDERSRMRILAEEIFNSLNDNDIRNVIRNQLYSFLFGFIALISLVLWIAFQGLDIQSP